MKDQMICGSILHRAIWRVKAVVSKNVTGLHPVSERLASKDASVNFVVSDRSADRDMLALDVSCAIADIYSVEDSPVSFDIKVGTETITVQMRVNPASV
ncbi:MAG: hypothetical protein ISN29_01460 [Gammaproteobacteria bacterium AqS3]|nr:hypothetical protein [Gammaproteobacteria bacterium AqS3]